MKEKKELTPEEIYKKNVRSFRSITKRLIKESGLVIAKYQRDYMEKHSVKGKLNLSVPDMLSIFNEEINEYIQNQ